MRTFDDEIARRLKEAADSGELRTAKGYGKPLDADAGWDATPAALRLPMKILKDAGAAPPEVELFCERARLRAALAECADPRAQQLMRTQLVELEQKLALRLESLRLHGV